MRRKRSRQKSWTNNLREFSDQLRQKLIRHFAYSLRNGIELHKEKLRDMKID